MTNTQLYISVGIPFFSLLVVFLSTSRSIDALRSSTEKNIDALRTEMRDGFTKIDMRFAVLERDLREFYATQKQHETRLDAIERKQAS